ncbi:SHOCT domain-containing protein [Stenotrophomonas sp. YIM B06876]|uniref:SHOCT domain-containing protein n=1 Tax=Stenotrophomonas sp. YIM B06876 TaxID=3060211 RepID=UPI002739C7C0|nr:SHOCT domain-containing protein [Stenotrophomonas sp. YIM B06876]
MGGVMLFQWVVWVCGASLFALMIGLLVRAVVRAARRPAPLHSAAERLQREAPLPPAIDAQLRELNDLKQRGVIGEAEYETRRAALIHTP